MKTAALARCSSTVRNLVGDVLSSNGKPSKKHINANALWMKRYVFLVASVSAKLLKPIAGF